MRARTRQREPARPEGCYLPGNIRLAKSKIHTSSESRIHPPKPAQIRPNQPAVRTYGQRPACDECAGLTITQTLSVRLTRSRSGEMMQVRACSGAAGSWDLPKAHPCRRLPATLHGVVFGILGREPLSPSHVAHLACAIPTSCATCRPPRGIEKLQGPQHQPGGVGRLTLSGNSRRHRPRP